LHDFQLALGELFGGRSCHRHASDVFWLFSSGFIVATAKLLSSLPDKNFYATLQSSLRSFNR
jgi:hypothetical protein